VTVASLIVLAAASSGLITQVLNTDIPQIRVFATLKLGDPQFTQDDVTAVAVYHSPIYSAAIGESAATGESIKTLTYYSTSSLEEPPIDENQEGSLISSNLTSRLTQLPQPGPPRIVPDDDCLFNPALPKCAPVAGKCPPAFLMNEEEQCFPDKPCPSGFTKLDEDETGTCYPVSPTTPLMTNGSNISSSDGS
jgi:hypothetical protein